MISVLGQQLWKNKLVSGVLSIALGAMVLAWPGPTILVAATLFGVYLLVSGFAELFLAFTLPRSAATRVLLFLTGALSLVLAILSFRHFGDGYAVLLLSLWLGVGFIFLGVSELAVAISERNLPGRGWYVVFRRDVGDRRRRRAGVAVRFPRGADPGFRCVTGDPRCDPNRAGIPDPQRHQDRGATRSKHYHEQVRSMMTRQLPARPIGHAQPQLGQGRYHDARTASARIPGP